MHDAGRGTLCENAYGPPYRTVPLPRSHPKNTAILAGGLQFAVAAAAALSLVPPTSERPEPSKLNLHQSDTCLLDERDLAYFCFLFE